MRSNKTNHGNNTAISVVVVVEVVVVVVVVRCGGTIYAGRHDSVSDRSQFQSAGPSIQ